MAAYAPTIPCSYVYPPYPVPLCTHHSPPPPPPPLQRDVIYARPLSSYAFLLSAPARFCSRTIRNFALGPYAILVSDRTQFCSWTVRNFALGPYAILLSDRCSYSFLLSNRCSYPRPTGPPYTRELDDDDDDDGENLAWDEVKH